MRLVPEAERTLRRIVVGLDANRTTHFLLPEPMAGPCEAGIRESCGCGGSGALRRMWPCWRQMDLAVQTDNPIFESQRRVYEAHGIRVIPVPIFPMGEGGIHCLVLK